MQNTETLKHNTMNKSESIQELSKALIQFQGKLVTVKKDGKNPHFGNRYASLSAIIEAVQKPLTECGLAVIQLPSGVNNLETILLHTSGEFISETYEMHPVKNDPQGVGSAITYQRRYALGSILCLNIDEDDDGEGGKVKMNDDRFAKMMDYIRNSKSKKEAENAINKARKAFVFDSHQESILNDLEDNIETLIAEEL